MPRVETCWRESATGQVLVCGGNSCPSGYTQIGDTSNCQKVIIQSHSAVLPVTGGQSFELSILALPFILAVWFVSLFPCWEDEV